MDSILEYLTHVPHKRITRAVEELMPALEQRIAIGDGPSWKQAYEALPPIGKGSFTIAGGAFSVGHETVIDDAQRTALMESLTQLIPWRKGPFNFFGTHIETEWRSDLKWNRLKDHIQNLNQKIVLDVGCNNGYYMYRMLEQEPKLVIGIDPSVICYYQFITAKRYITAPALHYLPCRLEQLDGFKGCFDTIFTMGIMYHRKSPLEYLKQTHDLLKVGGEAVIETITIPGDEFYSLCPEDRYAQMRNVYFLPTVPLLVSWIKKCGFVDITVVDTSPTTFEEQKNSPWVEGKSLEDFLDPNDPTRTIEGYPAPNRTTIVAHRRPKQKFSY
ncbi:MAG: tRNA 5-methoxyuridine(34)/uridine 5-oxyacetic acid(34) synthase CmoB [Fibrobacterales bacterium]